MTPADITPDIAYADLVRIVDAHNEPWATVAQCDVFLRAAAILRRREPAEAEHAGSRYAKRDIDAAMRACRQQRAVLAAAGHAPEVIVPTRQLR